MLFPIFWKLAAALGLPEIGDGESMSARLIKIKKARAASVRLEGSWYRVCAEGEEPTKPAPDLPDVSTFGGET